MIPSLSLHAPYLNRLASHPSPSLHLAASSATVTFRHHHHLLPSPTVTHRHLHLLMPLAVACLDTAAKSGTAPEPAGKPRPTANAAQPLEHAPEPPHFHPPCRL